MSRRVVTIPKSEEKWDEQGFEQPTEAEVAEQPGDQEPKHDEPPIEIQNILPSQEIEDEGSDASQEFDLETELQELAKPKTGGKRGDGSNVKGEMLPNPEPTNIPEAGEGQPQF
ncbi:P antigen family member 3-like [Tamandua tetradactyla]|uniref:P antigen family member 3-like n=1 Tax=Tamandua tetradactyla TaxID=48850 RepID=UPI004053BC38